MDEVLQIIGNIQKGQLKPIYFLFGEEPFFIDQLSDFIANNVLSEVEKEFNQMVLYGADVTIDDIVAHAKRYPMMADKQVVIVKEAQNLSRTIEKLTEYAKNPQPTTILVICYKYKKIDKRKALYTSIKKMGLVFESNKLYPNKVDVWVRKNVANSGYTISHKAASLLVEFLGTDLGKINNELDKLRALVPQQSEITAAHVEQHIGISKDYNNFELKKAIGERNILKATKIITYFSNNPKDHPIVVTVTLLNMFFTQLLQYHGLQDRSAKNVASALKMNPYFVTEIKTAAQNYPMKKVSSVISSLRNIDVKSKGVGANALSQADLLKELIYTIM